MAYDFRVRKSGEEQSSFQPFNRRAPIDTPELAAARFTEGVILLSRPPARRQFIRMGGYVPASPVLYRLWNLALVVPLILFCLPLLLVIAAALAATQGRRNVIYRGERIGKDLRRFYIYKFKTLRDEASRLTRDQVLPAGSEMETPIGKHLRDTRLDELPQLINVLLGDMNMLGPRPVRPSIAAACRERIPDYDLRFTVHPGLIGYTQALMPHGTDKVIRARINAALCRRKVALVQEVLFIALTGLSVIGWTLRVPLRLVLDRLRNDGWIASAKPRNGEAVLRTHERTSLHMRLVRLDPERLLVESDRPLPHSDWAYEMTLSAPRGWGQPRGKAARCNAIPLCFEQVQPAAGRPVHRYTMHYSPTSPLNRYLIDRYLLGRVVVR